MKRCILAFPLSVAVISACVTTAKACVCTRSQSSGREDYRVNGTSPLAPGPGHLCGFHTFGINSSCGCGSIGLITSCVGPNNEHDGVAFWQAVDGKTEPHTKLHDGCFRFGLTCVVTCPEGFDVDANGVCWPLDASTVAFEAAAGGIKQYQYQTISQKPGDFVKVTFPSQLPYGTWFDTSNWTALSHMVETRDEGRDGRLFKYRLLPNAVSDGSSAKLTFEFRPAGGLATLSITIANGSASGESHSSPLVEDSSNSIDSLALLHTCSLGHPCPPPPPTAGSTVHNDCILVERGHTEPSQCALVCDTAVAQDCPKGTACEAISGVGLCVNTTHRPQLAASLSI